MTIPREDFESIVHAHQAMLYRIAFNFFRNAHVAEDVVQDVFLELHQSGASLDSAAHQTAWLRRVATHRCIDLARRRSTRVETQLDELFRPSALLPVLQLLSIPPRPDGNNEVRQALEKINAGGREVLALDLDSVLLASALKSLGNGDLGRILSGLKSIQIRGFEIETPEAYRTRIQPIRDALKGPQWARYAAYDTGQNSTELWSGRSGNEPTGVLLLSLKDKRGFVMHVVGNLRPDQLLSLSGQLGMPSFALHLDPFRSQ